MEDLHDLQGEVYHPAVEVQPRGTLRLAPQDRLQFLPALGRAVLQARLPQAPHAGIVPVRGQIQDAGVSKDRLVPLVHVLGRYDRPDADVFDHEVGEGRCAGGADRVGEEERPEAVEVLLVHVAESELDIEGFRRRVLVRVGGVRRGSTARLLFWRLALLFTPLLLLLALFALLPRRRRRVDGRLDTLPLLRPRRPEFLLRRLTLVLTSLVVVVVAAQLLSGTVPIPVPFAVGIGPLRQHPL
mmetsp:Transcript_50522/g.152206  ORF Transcript_50522/g.152206 Transcript_50522/m.152206 type:complete len:242 (+) Transcript_50522:752-1477(+)